MKVNYILRVPNTQIPKVIRQRIACFDLARTSMIRNIGTLLLISCAVNFSYALDLNRKNDSLALVTLYNNAGGIGWTNKSGWLSSYITSWYGIITSTINGSVRVTSISLPGNNLTGTLVINSLTELQVLDVHNNPLPGGSSDYSINTKLTWIDASNTNMGMPSGIGNLTLLESLNLSGNNITQVGSGGSAIPTSITGLTKLTYLNLQNNKFTGSIPAAIGNLTNLTLLAFGQNLLTGSIPTGIGSLTKLTWLDFGNNQLTGTIPTQIGNLTLLQTLILGNNKLSGTIPIEIGNLTALKYYLWLGGGNQLTGTIPTQIGNLINLQDLRLDLNLLTGSIPAELGSLTQLTTLILSYNQLSGSIPTTIGNLVNLEDLHLDNNQLTGSIPSQLTSLQKLKLLWLWTNQLSGSIPSFLGNLISVQQMALDVNQFTGTVPVELNNLVNLTFLNFGSNPLTGTLPSNFLSNATQLQQIKIWNTNLTGTIPVSCLSSPNLIYALLTGNSFDGLPDIHSLPVFSNVNGKVEANNNYFTFEDIEPNRNIPSAKFVYAPQQNITAPPVSLIASQPLSLSFTVGGSANTYQWQLNGTNIPGTNSNTYSKTSTIGDGGNYTLVVNNTLVPSLTITGTVSVTVIPPPIATAATNITSTGFTANWATVTGATGYQLDISTDNFATFITGFNSKSVTGISQAVTGLTANTAYQYRIRAVNGAGTSGNSNVITATTSSNTGYCLPAHSSNTCLPDNHAYINSVSVMSGASSVLSNAASGCPLNSATTIGYSDYTSINGQLNPSVGYSGSVVTNAGGCLYVTVFIDYNGNGLFTDAGEMVFQITNALCGDGATNPFTFTIPANAVAGSTRMRVRADGSGEGVITDPCVGYTYGETEDYTISIASATTTSVPTISGFTPVLGPIGTTVKINGTNFSTTPANNIVFFGAVKASVTAATATQLTVTVPAGASFQPISVLVNGLTAYSNAPFAVTFQSTGVIDSSTAPTNLVSGSGNGSLEPLIADLDGDGKPELVTLNVQYNGRDFIGSSISIFKNNSSSGKISSSSFGARVDYNSGLNAEKMAIQDMDGDGKPDIVVVGDDGIQILKNTTTTGVIDNSSFTVVNIPSTCSFCGALAVGDMDNDGKPDMVVGDYSTANRVMVFKNITSTGSISASSFATNVDFPITDYTYGLSVADIDYDGKLDIVVGYLGSNNVISILRNTSTAGTISSNSFAAKVDFAAGDTPTTISIADIDNDGKQDVVVGSWQGSNVSVFKNTSTPGVIDANTLASRVDFNVVGEDLSVGDIDGDGKPDLVIANPRPRGVSVLKNLSVQGVISTSSFSSKVDFAGTVPYYSTIGDFDGDGAPEIVSASDSISVWQVFSPTLKQDQTISFLSILPRLASDQPFDLDPKSSAGLPVSYSSSNSSVATINGKTVTITGAGTTTITASQAGDAVFAAAEDQTQVLTVLETSPKAFTYRTQWGGPPSGWNLSRPKGLAIDAGLWYVADAGNNRILIADSNGNPTSSFGTFGSGFGQFNSPADLKVKSGKIYVADAGNNRIQIFDTAGNFLRSFGSSGSAPGQFKRTNGIALDTNENIYVSDGFNCRIQVFNNAGIFLRTFGSLGAGNGQFNYPKGIEVDSNGTIYVVDGGNTRVQVFDNNGNFLRAFGSEGQGNGQFNRGEYSVIDGVSSGGPEQVVLDGSLNIYVTDVYNNRVEKFDNAGNFLMAIGALGGPVGIDFDPDGNIIVAEDFGSQVQAFSPTGTSLATYTGNLQQQPYHFDAWASLVIDPSLNVYAGGNVFDKNGIFLRAASAPLGIDKNGNLFISESTGGDGRIAVYSSSGNFIRAFANSSSNDPVIASPSSLSVDKDGNAYVLMFESDNVNFSYQNKVYIYDNAGVLIKSFGTSGTGDGQFTNLNGLTIDASANIYVTDNNNKRVQVFDSNGNFIRKFGTPGVGEGQFSIPYGIASDTQGRIFVSDTGNARIEVFSNDGTYLFTQGSFGNQNGQFINPSSIAVDPAGKNLFVVNNYAIVAFGIPDITISQNNATIPSGGTFDFGNVNMFSNSGSIVFTVQNTGTVALNIDLANSTLTGANTSDFVVDLSSLNTAIPAGGSSQVKVTFTPSAPSPRTAIISVASNDLAQNPYVINLKGTGFQISPVATTATTISSTGFTANWNAVTGATGYQLDISSDNFATFVSGYNSKSETTTTDVVTGLTAGTTYQYRVRATNGSITSGNSNVISVSTTKSNQAITFTALADVTVGDPTFNLGATASSGLAVSYSTNTPKVTLNGNVVTIVSAGRDSITASQAGNTNFNAATPVKQSFCIKPAKPTITETGDNTATPILTSSAASGNQWFLNGTAIAGATNTTFSITAPGVYTVQAKVDDCVSAASNNFAIIVTGDIARSESVRLYPNPTKDFIFVSGIKESITESTVTDAVGRSTAIKSEKQGDLFKGDVNGLSDGMYILKIQEGTQVHFIKFIKQ